MTPAIEDAVVRVVDGDGEGTGFFIDERLIVTCAHVAQSPTLTIELADGRTAEGVVVLRCPDASGGTSWCPPDIALVEVALDAPAVADIALPDAQARDGLLAAGFVVGPSDVPTLTYERPVIVATEPLDGVRMLKLAECQLEPGMSGAPLIDAQTGRVLGIVKRSRGTEASVGGWAVPIATLDEHFAARIKPIRERRTASLLDAYYAAVIRRSETIEPRGMRRSRDAQDIVFPLDDVYLSLEMQRYHEADLRMPSTRSSTDAAIEPYLGIERIPDAPQSPEATSLTRLLSEGRRTTLLGGPGSGKTTLLQWIALHAARACAKDQQHVTVATRQIDPESSSEEPVEVTTARMPIAVRLADFHEHVLSEAEAGRSATLREFLVSSVCETAGDVAGDLRPHVSELMARGETIVLLDGMDELREMSHRQEVRDAIAQFASEATPAVGDASPPAARLMRMLSSLEGARRQPTILVTSRHAGYRDAALPPDVFEHGVIADLTDSAVRRFLHNWNLAVQRVAHGARSDDAETMAQAQRRAETIDAALAASPSLRAIARTPLLLTVITLVHDELGRLPQRRADLLLEMGKILVERRAKDHSFLDAGDILGGVALWLHAHRATGLLTKSEFNDHVRRFFPRLIFQNERGATVRTMAERFCADAEEQFGIIVERGADLVGFQHRMFQEFFAALEIASWSDDPFAAIAERLFDPQWREVVIFVACLEAKTGAQRGRHFMSRLLASGDQFEEQDERRRQALFLAADCLAEIERRLPETAVEIIGRLVDLHCVRSSPMPAREIAEATARLRAVAPLFPEETDLVLTSAFRDAPLPVRRALCEIILALQIDVPGIRTMLERRDGEPGTCLAERAALLSLRGRQDHGGPAGAGPGAPKWVAQIRQHLEPYGSLEALRTLDALGEEAISAADAAKQQYCESLLAFLETAVGVEAILAGAALLVVEPEALPHVLEQLQTRDLDTEASELLVWSAQNIQLPANALEDWSARDPEYRAYMLALLAREPSRDGAQDVAWAEVELAAIARPSESRLGEFDLLFPAMWILCATGHERLAPDRFRWLDELANRDADIASMVAFVLSGTTVDAAVPLEQLEPKSAAGRRLVAVSTARRGNVTKAVLDDVIDASDDPSGVWRLRTAEVLSRPPSYSNLGSDVVQALMAMLDAPLSPRTRIDLERFANAMKMDAVDDAPQLLDGTLSPELFHCPTPEVDALVLDWATSECPGREHAVRALNGRRNNGGARALPLLDPESRQIAWLMANDDEEEDAILAGALLARAALESEADAARAVDVLAAASCSETLEFALWAGEYGIIAKEQAERLALQMVERWPGAPGIAIAARLLASSGDSGLAILTSSADADEVLLADALLLAGDHPVMWSVDADHTAMRALSALVGGLCATSSFFESTIAASANALHAGCAWPRARFALHQLMQLGERAPDALEMLAPKYDLAAAVCPYLVNTMSFGVRARAFAVLARAGRLDEPMFDALVSGALDVTEVSTHVFEALYFIRSLEEEVAERIRTSLASDGLAAVAALDATLQLLHSYALDEDPVLRLDLVNSLVLATSTRSPWTMCRLPSGLGIRLLPSMRDALLRALTHTDGGGQIRPIMLARPTHAAQRPDVIDPRRSFTENFLARVRLALSAGRRPDAER